MAQLCRREEEFAGRAARIVLVSFESPADSARWQARNCPRLELLLDPERELYTLFGMLHSRWRNWLPRTVWRYLREVVRGCGFLASEGDSGQLGGNIIIDREGLIRWVHVSREPMDRPAVSELLQILERIGR